MSLKPYPQYIITPLVWCDKIPDSWKLLRAKNVFDAIDIRSKSGLEELLSVSEKSGVTPRRLANVTMFKAESYVGYKLCWSGDLVINSLWAWMQGLGFSTHHGIVSSAYGVYRLKPNYAGEFKYFNYLLRSSQYLWELRVKSKGIWRSRYQLTDESFFTIPIIIPPVQDRRQVVKYLDWKTSQINRCIKAKKRQIELLKEQKQVIINDAVTGKIDVRTGKPYQKYKDSGVEWLGKLPNDWEIRRIVSLLLPGRDGIKIGPFGSSIKSEIIFSKANFIDTPCFKVYGQEHAINKDFTIGDKYISEFNYRKLINYELFSGDIIITMMGTTGRSRVVPLGIENGIMDSHLIRIKVLTDIAKPDFVSLLINDTEYVKNQKTLLGKGSIMEGLNSRIIKDFILLVPSLKEQEEIMIFLEKFHKKNNSIINRIEKEISHLQEYYARLIADVVTGKVDVRNIKVPEYYIKNGIEDTTEIAEDMEEEIIVNE